MSLHLFELTTISYYVALFVKKTTCLQYLHDLLSKCVDFRDAI